MFRKYTKPARSDRRNLYALCEETQGKFPRRRAPPLAPNRRAGQRALRCPRWQRARSAAHGHVDESLCPSCKPALTDDSAARRYIARRAPKPDRAVLHARPPIRALPRAHATARIARDHRPILLTRSASTNLQLPQRDDSAPAILASATYSIRAHDAAYETVVTWIFTNLPRPEPPRSF